MIKVFSIFVTLFLVSTAAFAQAVNPARTYEQQRNSQSPADGIWHVYDRYGNLQKEENYKSYRLDGYVKTFSAGGGLRSITPYVDGSRQGLEKTYYPSGSLQAENIYKGNDLNGMSKEYYQTGQLKRAAMYLSGQLNGFTKIYYEDGALKQQWEYKQGVIHGTALTYKEDGHVQSEDNYQNGVLVAHKDYTNEIAAMTASSVSRPPVAGTTNTPKPEGQKQMAPAGKDNTAFSGAAGSVPSDYSRKTM